MESTVLQDLTLNHKFQAYLGGWGSGTDPDTSENLWKTGAMRNFCNYSNPEVDRAVKKAISNGNMSTLNCPDEVELSEKLELYMNKSKSENNEFGGLFYQSVMKNYDISDEKKEINNFYKRVISV